MESTHSWTTTSSHEATSSSSRYLTPLPLPSSSPTQTKYIAPITLQRFPSTSSPLIQPISPPHSPTKTNTHPIYTIKSKINSPSPQPIQHITDILQLQTKYCPTIYRYLLCTIYLQSSTPLTKIEDFGKSTLSNERLLQYPNKRSTTTDEMTSWLEQIGLMNETQVSIIHKIFDILTSDEFEKLIQNFVTPIEEILRKRAKNNFIIELSFSMNMDFSRSERFWYDQNCIISRTVHVLYFTISFIFFFTNCSLDVNN